MRDNGAGPLDSTAAFGGFIAEVDSAPVWSVLDELGTQHMMRSVLGQASSLANYKIIEERLLAASYGMGFGNGMTLDLKVKTSDTITALGLASMAKVGVLYHEATASLIERRALENTSVESIHNTLQLHFKADGRQFEALLKSDLFAAVAK